MGVAISGEQYLWPGRTVPYVIDPGFADVAGVTAAVEHWNQNSVIRFVPRGTEPDYVVVINVPGGANSDVGRRGGEQQVCLGEGCPVGSIIHELGHTVGLWHEHCRHDRDQYVTVDFPEIDSGSVQNFAIDSIAGEPTPTTDIGDYDFGSIMHYSETACAFIDGTPVLIPKEPLPPGVVQGQREALSPGDLTSVATLYAGVAAAAGA
jgi:Astacin (Peptidase family M12A)